MHLRVNLNGNVEVVIPVGFNRSYIPDFVEKNHPWIAKTMLRLEKKFSLKIDKRLARQTQTSAT